MRQLFSSGEPWFAAAGTLLAGVVVALAAGLLVRFVARRVLVDEDRAGHASIVAFWGVVAVFGLVAVVRLFGGEFAATGLSVAADRLFASLPDVVLAVLLLAVGFVLATGLRGLVQRGLDELQPGAAPAIGAAVYWTILVVAGLLAANQLGVRTQLADQVVALLVAGVVLAVALAFGLGSRDLLGAVMAGRHVARILAVGDEIETGSHRGAVVRLGPASVRLRDPDTGVEAEVPNSVLLSEVVVIHRRAQDAGEAPDAARPGSARAVPGDDADATLVGPPATVDTDATLVGHPSGGDDDATLAGRPPGAQDDAPVAGPPPGSEPSAVEQAADDPRAR